MVKPYVVRSGVGEVVQKYTPIGLNSPREDQDGSLSGANGAGGGRSRAGGRGSISRQGGLNS